MTDDLIYILQAGDTGPVKIGRSTTTGLDRRILQMQTGNPEPLLIRALYRPRPDRAEKHLHALFAEHCTTGEWFAAGVLAHLDQIDLQPIAFDPHAQTRKAAIHQLRRRHANTQTEGAT